MMQTATFTTTSADETRALARCLSGALHTGDLLALNGELGAGKTCFVQGLAAGLHAVGRVTSPTFIIMRRHETVPPGGVPEAALWSTPALYHVDAYRLRSGLELWEMGLEEWLEEGVVAIEWAEQVREALPLEHLELRFAHAGDQRLITALAHGRRGEQLLEQLRRCGF